MLALSRRRFIRSTALIAATPWLNAVGSEWKSTQRKRESHQILCCNIRVDLPEDEEKGFGWNGRKDICVQIIRSHQPDIICLQEVLQGQMEDLKVAFPTFKAFGFEGPEMDVRQIGYHGIAKNPIMFSEARYEFVSGGCYWLSETPLVAGSISWDSARARHANWVRLKDKETGVHFRVVNLHLDHKSQPAKEGQIKLVVDESSQYTDDFPQILTGDFNGSMANRVYQIVKSGGWADSYTTIHGEGEAGYTVHLFQGENYEKKDIGRKIDFIFSKGDTKAVAAEIIRDHVDGKYPSDHYFVSAKLLIGG